MPITSPAVQKVKDKSFLKAIVKHNGNVSAVAREMGIHQQSAYQRVKAIEQRDAFREFIDSPELRIKLAKLYEQGSKATKRATAYAEDGKTISVDDPDWAARHRFCNDLVRMMGYLKTDGSDAGTTNFNSLTLNLGKLEPRAIEDLVNGLRARIGQEQPVLDNQG